MCAAKKDVRFAPNSDRESGFPANGHVRFTPESGHLQCNGANNNIDEVRQRLKQQHHHESCRCSFALAASAPSRRSRETRPVFCRACNRLVYSQLIVWSFRSSVLLALSRRCRASSMNASSSSSGISFQRLSFISNSLGANDATTRRYSTGRSTRATFTASSPYCSKSFATASSSAVQILSREPFLRPPVFVRGSPGLNCVSLLIIFPVLSLRSPALLLARAKVGARSRETPHA